MEKEEEEIMCRIDKWEENNLPNDLSKQLEDNSLLREILIELKRINETVGRLIEAVKKL
jgi:hypothetical protein